MQLRNKAPRWHDAYQCWCLDFGGRVTQASVKNFQLVAQGSGRVLMQFGRTSHKDVFVMDYEARPARADAVRLACCRARAPALCSLGFCVRSTDACSLLCGCALGAQHPLSAVQAFAVCLSAFDTKLACR